MYLRGGSLLYLIKEGVMELIEYLVQGMRGDNAYRQ